MPIVKRDSEVIDVEVKKMSKRQIKVGSVGSLAVKAAVSIFAYVAAKTDLAPVSNEVEKLDRQCRRLAILSVISLLSSVGVTQAVAVKHPLLVFVPNGLAAVFAIDGLKAKKRLDGAREIATVHKHVDLELVKRQAVGDRFVEYAPLVSPGGIGGKLVTSLAARKMFVNLLGVVNAPSFYRIKIAPTGDMTIQKLRDLAETLQTSLGVNNAPIIAAQAHYWTVDVERPDREFVTYEEFAPQVDGYRTDSVTLPVGVNIDRRLIEVSPLNPNTCHLLIGGTTGSGKSEFLRCVARWLMQWSPNDVQIVISDPKFVTFMDFMGVGDSPSPYSAWLPYGVVDTAKETLEIVDDLVEQMDHRYKLFQQHRVKDIAAYNSLMKSMGKPHLPLQFVIIDEYADLITAEQFKKKLENQLIRLGQKARASGIMLLIGTQRPSIKILSPELRENLVWRIGMLMTNAAGSYIVMGGEAGDGTAAGSANCLLGAGDMISDFGKGIERLQAIYWDGTNKPKIFDVPKPKPIKVEPPTPVSTPTPSYSLSEEEIERGAEIVDVLQNPHPVMPIKVNPDQVVSAAPTPASVKSETEQLYLKYRAHREIDLPPYKFLEQHFAKATAEKKMEVEAMMLPYFDGWIRELNQRELLPEQIVKIIWNLTIRDKNGGAVFKSKLEYVHAILGVKNNGTEFDT